MLGNIYHILSLSLGEPVKTFTFAFKDKNGKQIGKAKTYTPQEFYKETVGGPLNGTFIMAMNDPRRPYYKTYEIEYDRHTYDGHNWKYVNLPMEDIAKMAIASTERLNEDVHQFMMLVSNSTASVVILTWTTMTMGHFSEQPSQ